MATTTLNTRLRLKYDTLANWQKNNPVILAGEAAVVVVPAKSGVTQNEPTVLIKIGDGTKKFAELDYITAYAGDVYAWAKAAEKPSYTADEISGLENYINTTIKDTDTLFQVVKVNDHSFKLQSKAKDATAWTDVGDPITITYTCVEGTENGTVKFNGVDVAVHGLGSAAFTNADAYDTAGAADGVKTALIGAAGDASSKDTIKGAKKYADEQVKPVGDKVNTLIGTDTGKSARTIANEELAKQLIPENAKESLDTLQEIAAWIQAHPDDVTAMQTAIQALQTKVTLGTNAQGTEYATVKAYVEAAIAALHIGDYATAANLTALADRVTPLETAKHTHANKTVLDGITATKVSNWDAAEKNAKDHADTEIGKLHVVAKSGNAKDLVQTAGDYIIFNCGTSSTVI